LFGYNTTPYALAAESATQAAAKKYNATVTFFNGNSSATTQTTQMQDAITTGKYQAFIVWPNDGLALQPVVKQAAAAGIKVATMDETLGSTQQEATIASAPGVTVAIGTGLLQEAQVAVSTIESACTAQVGASKPCSVALMPGMQSFPPDVYRLNYIQSALKKTGYISASLTPQGDYDAPGAQAATLNYFQTQPHVDVLYTFADQMVSGILVALKQLHLTPGKDLQIIGFGATTEALAGIKAGTWFASQGLYPSAQSDDAVKYLVAAVHGQQVPAVINAYQIPGALPVIDKAVLQQDPSFTPDWSYSG
jgi:ribose transport system substrate-binding protein